MGLLAQSRTEGKEFCSPPVSKKSEVADAHEAAGQQVEKEAAQELFDRQSHDPLLVTVGGVAPAKSGARGISKQRISSCLTRR
jgi:hypothetical protein